MVVLVVAVVEVVNVVVVVLAVVVVELEVVLLLVVEVVLLAVVVLEVVLLVVVVVVVLEVVLLLIRQTVGSGSSPRNSSLWLSALPEKDSSIILPLIWLKVVLAAAKGARTEP